MCKLCTFVGISKRTFHSTTLPEPIQKYFPESLKIDDYISRTEKVLSEKGFRGDNTIAMINICRDEVTNGLKKMVDTIFGNSFTTIGLGGVLTCGVTGMGAGLSHSPVCKETGKERYVFFSYPHIGIHPNKEDPLGFVNRKGRTDYGTACGALIKCMTELKKEGLEYNLKKPGLHNPEDIEYSILKQRLARTIQSENTKASLNLADITSFAEKRITEDLETLIEKTVDTKKADYAVMTGIQIHYWTDPDNYYRNEYIHPGKSYAVINNEKITIPIRNVLPLSQRQLDSLFH